MSLRLVTSMLAGEWQRAMDADRQRVTTAAMRTMKATAARVKSEGRSNIAGAGFSSKWQNALRVTVYPTRGQSIDAAVYIRHKIPYAAVFEQGARIAGKPLLWLPLPNVQQRYGGRRMTPKLFVERVGPLHTIRVTGKRPMLAGYVLANSDTHRLTVAKLRNGQRASSARRKSVPVFVGISSVELHKRFDLTRLFREAGADVPALYDSFGGAG